MAPKGFHQSVALSILAAVIGRRVYMRLGSGIVHANLWCLIVGNSSTTKKTSALKLGKRILGQVIPDERLADASSPEGLIAACGDMKTQSAMHCGDYAPAWLWPDEFSRLPKAFQRDFMAGWEQTVILLKDGDSFTKRLANKKIVVPAMHLTWCSASVMDDLTNALSVDNYLSGLIPRFAIRVCDGRWAAQVVPTQWMLNEEQWLVGELKKLSNAYLGKETEVLWSASAKRLWDAKSRDFHCRGRRGSIATAVILSRLVEDILPEFIIIQAVSDNGMTFLGDTWTADVKQFRKAEKAIKPYIADAIKLSNQVGGEKNVKKLRGILERAGKTTRSVLIHTASNAGMKTSEVDEGLETLAETHEVTSYQVLGKKGKKTRIYEYHKKKRR